jgi:hypothetical protein
MTEDVYRILYCSRNTMDKAFEDQLDEIRGILATSRANNAARDITGALLFNAGCFAQVLEGPLKHVEYLEAGHVARREFPEWSMAFAGAPRDEMTTFSEFSVEHAFKNPTAAAEEIHNLLRTLVIQEDE